MTDAQPRISDPVFPSRSGEKPIIGYRKVWSRIAKLGDPPSDVTPHVLRHSFATLAADLGYNESTIATLLGHKTHGITSRYVHTADAVLLALILLFRATCSLNLDSSNSAVAYIVNFNPLLPSGHLRLCRGVHLLLQASQR